MKKISNDTIKNISFLRHRGFSIREIAVEIGIHHSTVSRYLKLIKCEILNKSASGRPKKLSTRLVKHLIRLVDCGHLKMQVM